MNQASASDQALQQEFREAGYVVVRQFLAEPDLRQLKSELDRYIRDVVPTIPATDAFYLDPQRPESLKQLHRMDQDPFFRDYMQNPQWNRLAEVLLGERVEAMAPEWFNKPAGSEHPTPPHQDNFYFKYVPPQVVTLWLALDVVDQENGCLGYIRGSHRQGQRPHQASGVLGFSQHITDFGPADRASQVTIPLQPGDLVAHHCETIHLAEPNRSPRDRRAFAIVFRGQSAKRDEAAFQQYLQQL